MSVRSALRQRAGRLALLGLICLLAGCAGLKPATGTAPAGGLKDIATESDESSASKRAHLRLELAAAYFGQGQMTTALDQVKLALAADPKSGPAYNLRGLIYANLGDQALAEESFRSALQINPQDADSLQNFGYYLCQQKRYAEADMMFAQALAVPQYTGKARTLLTQGVCQAVAGNLPDAEKTLTRSFEADPTNPPTSVNLAEVLYRRGEYERARFYIRRINALPGIANAQTFWLAARIENRLGNRSAVQDFGRRLGEGFPDSPEWAKFQRGAFDE
jgi:type IV pilus assembly protein PilF